MSIKDLRSQKTEVWSQNRAAGPAEDIPGINKGTCGGIYVAMPGKADFGS
jgi:hypothetical protein